MLSLTNTNPPSPAIKVATSSQRWAALGFTLILGAFLAAGFLPLTQSISLRLEEWLTPLPITSLWMSGATFAIVALAFWLSLPTARDHLSRPLVWLSLPLPVGIALLYAKHQGQTPYLTPDWIAWYALWTPLGEEWLFRGWAYALGDRLWSRVWASWTNPLPMAVWVSAGAFSLWHLQTPMESLFGGLFTLGYTFAAGLWLGWLRWQTGGLTAPVIAHLCINAVPFLLP